MTRTKKNNNNGLRLKEITPLTPNQERVFSADKHVLSYGTAGTGKTLCSFYIGLLDVIDTGLYDRLIIVRSAVPARDQGFLKGSLDEKQEVYELPYKDMASQLFQRGDAYEILKQKGYIDFISSSYLRGITIDNSVLLVDEIQNFTWEELNSVITRLGKNTRLLLCGDLKQNDLVLRREKTGMLKALDILLNMKEIECIEFTPDDIVRDDFVRAWILATEKYEKNEHSRNAGNTTRPPVSKSINGTGEGRIASGVHYITRGKEALQNS